jgi:hypothetical protein
MSALPPKADMAQDDCHKRTWDLVLAASFCVVGFVRTSALLPKAEEALAADAQRPQTTNSPLQRSAEWPRAKSKCLQRTARLNKKPRKFSHKASDLSAADICYGSTGK